MSALPSRIGPELLGRPKGEAAASDATLPLAPPALVPVLSVAPVRAELPEARSPITLRLKVSIHEALRLKAFTERTSIQAIVDELLDDWMGSQSS